jgi:hypothetical protein
MNPIETHYAGCRFRSRLEARWAVFFDCLGVKWDYEPQGYLVGEKKRPYLPDFWLPGLSVWVEVKGDMSGLDMSLLDDAVSHPGGLPTADPFGELGILVLGPIPEPGVAALHWLLSRTVYAPCRSLEAFCACNDLHFSQQMFISLTDEMLNFPRVRASVGELAEAPGAALFQIGRTLLRPIWDDIVAPREFRHMREDPAVDRAYSAARSARFEHGESGAA